MTPNPKKLDWQEPEYGALQSRLPAVCRVLDQDGQISLKEYCRTFKPWPGPAVQSNQDFIQVCAELAGQLMGPDTASRMAAQLQAAPVILTANHLGVDCHPLFIQGNLLFGLASGFDRNLAPIPGAVVPILSFGTVSLGNQVFSRGLLLSRQITNARSTKKQVRLNIFPSDMRRTMVSAAPAFSPAMVRSGLGEADRLHRAGVIKDREREVLLELLESEYLAPDVLELARYADQASLINSRIWRRLFAEDLRTEAPPLVPLEMEQVVGALLKLDLKKPNSLLSQCLFDPRLRDSLMQNLEEAYGCWNRARLAESLTNGFTGRAREEYLSRSGTSFFWAVNDKGRQVRLALVRRQGTEFLEGLDHEGRSHVFELTPRRILRALKHRELYPNLFTSFLVVALARGVRCYGGFWQADYLPVMQAGLVKALRDRGHIDRAEKIAQVPTSNYVTGMTFVLADYPDADLTPAGTVEILARGGLSARDLGRLADISVEEANLFGLTEICRNFAPADNSGPGRERLVPETQIKPIVEKMVRIDMES